jgi:DNA polymerase III gamma/tau subunit
MKISSKISLAVIGLIAFAGTPTMAVAQQEKGGVGEATERQQGEAGSVEKTHESNTAEPEGKKKKKPQSKAGKVVARNKDAVKAVAQEMNRYTNQQARLKKGRDVAAEKNDEAMKKKVKDLTPKVAAKHEKEMAKLRGKYGEEAVKEALEVIEKERKRGKDGKVNRAGTNKKKKQNQRRNQKNNKGGSGEGSGESES